MRYLAIALTVCFLAIAAIMGVFRLGFPSAPPLGKGTVTITTQKGEKHSFTVEVASSQEARNRGLMYRKHLEDTKGMLFLLPNASEAAFWMKHTYIPLDMVFIRKDGKIIRIEEQAEPESLRPIPSGGKVVAVLELAGGVAKRLNIAVGDTVSWSVEGQ